MAAPAIVVPAPAPGAISQSAIVTTPTDTIAVQLMPAPAPRVNWAENPAIIVPVLTFIGVLITVGLGVWKTNKELNTSDNKWKVDREDARVKVENDRKHAAEEARKARLITARREVYLELIKEMTAASMALGAMAFQKGEELDVQGGFQGFLSAAARVGILGEMNTVVKSRELMIMVNQILYKKLPEIIEMKFVRKEQDKFEQAKKAQLERSEGIKKIMSDLLLQGRIGDVKPWAESLEKSDAQAKVFADEAANFSNGHVKLAKAYQRSILPDTAQIAQKTNELIDCIRTELELITDVDALKSTTAEMYKAAAESIEKMQDHYKE
jgi:hypothetical protein